MRHTGASLRAAIYDILFKASAETLITIAADPKHLGARVSILSVLHTWHAWGSALTHHPKPQLKPLWDLLRAAAKRSL